MVRFQGKCIGGIPTFKATIDNIHRFNVKEAADLTGGWFLHNLNWVEIGRFTTLYELQQYIEEMDK